jgi:hypothetical protein
MLSLPFFPDLPQMTDSILVFFNTGVAQSDLPITMKVRKIIFRKTPPDAYNMLAILQLDNPIGNELGWLGCGFSTSDSLILSRQYYKFSFPDSLMVYDSPNNGDTLKLSYGKMGSFNSARGHLRLSTGFLNSGMGGSSLFYQSNNDFIITGVSTWGSNYGHTTFTKRDFYLYKQIIENTSLSIQQPNKVEVNILCYPNTTGGEIILTSQGNLKLKHVRIFDTLGKLVHNSNFYPSKEINVEISSFNTGIYFVQAELQNGISRTFKIYVNK